MWPISERFGSPGGLPSRDLILPLCTKIASLAGRGCGYDLLQQLEGGGRCGNSALQVGVKWHDGQASVLVARCLALSGISVCPSSSWRSAFIYLKLMFDKPSYYLEDLKLLRMGGREAGTGLYTLLCLETYCPFRHLEFGRSHHHPPRQSE